MNTGDSARDPVEKLAEEFVERFRRGERPSLTEYTTQYPDLADQIRDLFPALVTMEQFGSVADADQESPDIGNSVATIPRQLGEFRILREVGRGGMGVVFEAVQESLGRHVALKVLAFHGLLKPTYLERFSREARAAARLHHTNIVPVFGIGEHQGIHYYAMQFIQGQGLDVVLKEVRRLRRQEQTWSDEKSDACRELTVSIAHSLLTGHTEPTVEENGTPIQDPINFTHSASPQSCLPQESSPPISLENSELVGQSQPQYFRSVARLGAQVAEALDYAHKQGILHRDIKPSNLLLDTAGTAWITDFGLVKAEGSDELTSPGDIVGTIRFMAPERLQGKTDPGNDIYGLGITLYEMLTLRPAFEDSNRARLIERVTHEDPPRPRKIDAHIPRDLETIVLKAIAKEPARRYSTAEGMAEDLRRFLADRPIRARRASSLEKVWRWSRRNPMQAILTSSVAALVLALVVGLSVAVLMRKERNEAMVNRDRAEILEQKWHEEHDRAVATAHLADARASRWSGKVGQRFRSLEELAAAAQHRPSVEIRNEAIACLALTDLKLAKSWDGYPAGTTALTFDAKFEHYARSDTKGNISVRRVADDREIATLPGVGRHAFYLKFSPDGRFLAAIYDNHHPGLYVWNWRNGQPFLKLGLAGGMDFSPDSRRLVLGVGGSIRLYDLASGKEEKRIASGQGSYDFAFDLIGRKLAVAFSQPNSVQIYDFDAAKVVMTLPNQQSPSWSLDSKLLATISNVRIHVWDALSGNQLAILQGHDSTVTKVAFNHRGDLLASTSWDGTLRLWDPLTGRQLLMKEGGIFNSPPQFSPDDHFLAHTITSSKVELWEVARSGAVCRVLHGPLYGVGTSWTDFSPDQRLLASASEDGVRLWDCNSGQEGAFLPIGQTHSVLFHPTDGSLISSSDRGLYRWPIKAIPDSQNQGLLVGPPQLMGEWGATWEACLDLDGHKIAVAQRNRGRGLILGLEKKTEKVALGNHLNIARIAISPDGRWVATATWWGFDSSTKVWDAQSGELVRDLPNRELQGDATVAFSPDGRWLVTGNDRRYRFWEVGSWEPGRLIEQEHAGFGAMAFSRDGKMMAIVQSPKRVQVIDLASDSELASFDASDPRQINHLCFSPDGSRLAAGCDHQTIQVWDLRAIRGELASMDLDWDLPAYPPSMAGDNGNPVRIKVDMGTAPTADLSQPLAQLGLNSFLLTMSPFNCQAYMQRGIAHTRLREWRPAIDDFSMVLTLLPSDAKTRVRALVQRSYNYGQIKDYSRTLDDLQQALKLDPDDLQACNNLAWLYSTGPENLRSPELALPLAQKAVDKAANKWEFLNTLGVVFYRLGEYDQAIATLERSLREGNNQAAAFDLFFLAMCHARLGDSAKAKNYYDRAVKWIQEHQDQVTPEWAEELKDFRAEADTVLVKSGPRSQGR